MNKNIEDLYTKRAELRYRLEKAKSETNKKKPYKFILGYRIRSIEDEIDEVEAKITEYEQS